METYLVGGAVRDGLLGRPIRERDWVVVGATPEEMRRRGYRQVGRDFPVFLHPDTAEEHALARTERKTGPGHTGFVCHAGPEVTLEDDLARRDLTVNAMARRHDDTLVDPFGGCRDLEARVLRHVSDAFVEDPLRVYRVARFAAQLPGFVVAPETLALMRRMVREEALAELSAERVWQELVKALACDAPERFFEVLTEVAAFSPWLTELKGVVPRFPKSLTEPERRFAALAWNRAPEPFATLCRRLKAPKRFQLLAERVAAHGCALADWRNRDPESLLDVLTAIGALGGRRDPEPLLTVVETCSGRDLTALRALIVRLQSVGSGTFLDRGLTGQAVGAAIRDARLDLIVSSRAGG